jgi:hypothetical protein
VEVVLNIGGRLAGAAAPSHKSFETEFYIRFGKIRGARRDVDGHVVLLYADVSAWYLFLKTQV